MPCDTTLKWGDNRIIKVKQYGVVKIRLQPLNIPVTLERVLFVPEFKINLLSQGVLVRKGVTVVSKLPRAILYNRNKVLTYGEYKGNLTLIYTESESAYNVMEKAANTSYDVEKDTARSDTPTTTIWHQRMGHIGQPALKTLENATIGAKISTKIDLSCDTCETCIQAKATVKVSRNKPHQAEFYLEKIHSDICGPISPLTWTKKKYFTSFIDDFSRFADAELLSSKDQVFQAYKTWQTREENQTGSKIRIFHSDNAREYKSLDFQNLHSEKGVKGTYSAPYTPHQNGIAERFNRTIMEKVRAMLLEARLPKMYWGEALSAALYLYNRTPNSSIGFKTPYEAKTGEKPDISNIRIWGSIAYRVMPKEGQKKLANRAKRYILVGYNSGQYKLADPDTRKTIIVPDAKIIEGKYLYNSQTEDPINIETEEEDNNAQHNYVQPDKPREPMNNKGIEELVEDDGQLVENHDQPSDQLVQDLESDQLAPINFPNLRLVNHSGPQEFDYSDLISQLQSYADNDVIMETAMATIEGPNTYKAAINDKNAPKWLKAMQIELDELARQNTWDLVPLPPGKNVIPGRWVLAIKDIEPEPIYKARWVAKGFHQRPGEDFNETYANTVNPVVYRLILAFAALSGWEIHQWDVKSAFPNANLTEEVYVKQPTGFEQEGKEHLVCLLNKALYGLKQSAREWEHCLRALLKEIGIIYMPIDQSVYYSTEGIPIILITHVDDILALSPSVSRVSEVYNLLHSKITLKNMGEANTFLGIQILRDKKRKTITLHQSKYTQRILQKYRPNYTPRKVASEAVPILQGQKVDKFGGEQTPELITQYQQQIGAILYLTTKTRPDIAYATGLLSRYMSNPGPEHFKVLDKLWKYLATNPEYGLHYHSESPELAGYCDSDWGGDLETRRSTTGFIYLFRGTPLSWNSKLQKTTALSSCEAEYMALKEAIKEQEYLKAIGNALPFFPTLLNPELLYTDSQSAIQLANNPGHHYRTKHIDIQYHFVRQKVQEKDCNLVYVPTEQQLADFLTKAIPALKWKAFIQGIGLIKINEL